MTPNFGYDFGGIAQLVERCPCKADVSGSSPLISTRKNSYEKTQKNQSKVVAHAWVKKLSWTKLKRFFWDQQGQMKIGVGWIPRHLETMKGVEPTKRFGELETSNDPEIPE